MLKNLILCHKINKFYKIFGEALNMCPCRTRVRDLKQDGFLCGVHYDITEAIEAQGGIFTDESYFLDRWLNKLLAQLEKII